MKKKIIIAIMILMILIIATGIGIVCLSQNNTELVSIKTEKQLEQRYSYKYSSQGIWVNYKAIITMPFSLIAAFPSPMDENVTPQIDINMSTTDGFKVNNAVPSESTINSNTSNGQKDYSTTNIQVENVDEADIIKTDGDYIYSISGYDVVITNAENPENPKIASKITATKGAPEDMIINGNILAVILANRETGYDYDTIVNIYDASDKENPKLIKTYTMYEPYYTSRCIDNKLYVISSGTLRKEDNKIITTYEEDRKTKEIGLENIKYLTDIETRTQTLISFIDLSRLEQDVKINSYLIDISNAYVSENYIYLLNEKYRSRNYAPPISSIFGIKGVIGAFDYDEYDDYGYYTDIYKFAIEADGEIEYKAKTNVKGRTINQYSLDEYQGNIRVAVYTSKEGSRVVIFDENLKEIGTTEYLAKGEKMYSSRFVGDRAYLVTYKTMDPLFVIDLSNPQNPKILGELKIPGYSTYLHPYDENHLIGIGMQTEEVVNRNANGKIISTTAKVTGMKMALFDITDVENPKEISNVVIGDSYTTSAILTNPKALLFSREKGIIAIPVNRYSNKFEINASNTYNTLINNYTNNSKSYISEGYFVCNIDIENGFTVKGTIVHEVNQDRKYYNSYKLLRGIYIEDDLYTVSENEIKVNKLDTLEEIGNLKIKGGNQ